MIKLSFAGFANYMASAPAQQRKILRDFKFPDPEGKAQAKYYAHARDAIGVFHRNRHPREWLEHQAERLTAEALRDGNHRRATKLRQNARALKAYALCASSGAELEVLPDIRLDFRSGDVRITVVPDLHVRHQGRIKVMKFDFTNKPIDKRKLDVATQVLYEAAASARIIETPRDAIYLDVVRGKTCSGKRAGGRMKQDIEAACEAIAAIWPTLKPRALGIK